MSNQFDDRMRELLEQIDARLRDAERLRNHAEQRAERPLWPDRRGVGRVPAADPHDPPRDTHSA